MINKVLFNIQHIKGFQLYVNHEDNWWTYIPKGTKKTFKLFWCIPLFSYTTKEDKWQYHVWGDKYTRQEMLEEMMLAPNQMINEDMKVVDKPFVCIWFNNDKPTKEGATIRKYFDTKEEALEYHTKIVDICKENNIKLQNSDFNYEN